MTAAFIDRLLPAPRNGGFRREGYWNWCGSVIRGEDGRYHMFASQITRDVPFAPNWVTNSVVVRASSDTPEGPYVFEEEVLPPRDPDCWDGRMSHNPTIHKSGDTYLLFYTGTTYDESIPAERVDEELYREARANQRIGLATAPSVCGPWTRRDDPILQPRPGKWDGLLTSNAAPCVLPDGGILLVYKSVGKQKDLLRLGVTKAESFAGPYVRLSEDPILCFDETGDHVEDPYLWWTGEHFEMIMKDMEGGICGEAMGGIHAVSADGVQWAVSSPPKAYSRTVLWDDGTTTTQGSFERPQLLIEDGTPTHLFAATADGPGGFWNAENTWNMVIPLRTGDA